MANLLTCTCKACGENFRPKKRDRATFCGRSCAYAYQALMAAISSPPSYLVGRPLCDACGSRFSTKHSSVRFCMECRAGNYAVARANMSDAHERECFECKASFTTTYGDKRTRFCCSECGRRNARRVRKGIKRAQRYGAMTEAINAMTVFQRDGWICQICGVETPMSLRGTNDDRAPEVDHVVALSMGGNHLYANVQCLCRRCNHTKAAIERPAGDLPPGVSISYRDEGPAG